MPTMPYDIAQGYSHHDWKPTHRPDPLALLKEAAEEAWSDHNRAVDMWMEGVITREELDKKRRTAEFMQDELDKAQHGGECTCKPNDVMTCPACSKYLRERYPDAELPF